MTSVPGVETYHPRATWQDPTKPVTGLSARWDQITTNVAHYTADDDLIDGDPGEHANQLPAYLRQTQASYLRTRGYSLGYLFAVDWLGGVWEIRGFDIRSAANAGDERKTGVKNFNRYSFPVLFLVDRQDGLTAEAQHTARMLYREAERRAGRLLGRPRPHSDIDFTQCCGDGIRADIAAGLLDPTDPQPVTSPQPLPDPDQKDDDMAVITVIRATHRIPFGDVYRTNGFDVRWVAGGSDFDQLCYRVMEVQGEAVDYTKRPDDLPHHLPLAGNVQPAVDGNRYVVITDGGGDLLASYGPIIGPRPAGVDEYGR